MRLVSIWLLLTLASYSVGQSLILIPSRDAGPIGPAQDVGHTTWTLWPHPLGNGENRYLSILSGLDWRDANRDPSGYRLAILDRLGTLPKIEKGVPLPRLSESGKPTVFSVSGKHAWDDVAKIVRYTGGRSLVVESPDSEQPGWTRVWLLGKPWPEGVPTLPSVRIAGLIPARDLGRLLVNPEDASWSERDSARFVPPSRWLGFGHDIGPIVLLFATAFAAYVIGLAIYCIVREVQSRVCLALLRIVVLGPALLILPGRLTSFGPVENWTGFLFLSLALLPIAAWGLGKLLMRFFESVHPLAGECIVGALVLLFSDPAWSIFSHILSPHPFSVSLEWFGSLSAYIVCLGYLLRTHYVGVFAAVVFWIANAVYGFGRDLPLGTSTWIPIVIAATPSALGTRMRWFVGLFLGIWMAYKVRLMGFTYAPDGLYPTYASRRSINCADHLAMVASPTFIALVSSLGLSLIFRDHFLGHQFRRTIAFSPRSVFLFTHALLLFLCGIFIPIYLHAAVATGLAAGVILLFDGVRTP